MSSETPGAGLARLKVQHPAWQISRIVLGGTRPGFVAIKPDGGKPLTADSPGALESKLLDQWGQR